MKNLVIRGLTGSVYVAILIFCTLHSFWALAGLFFIFQTVAVREFRSISKALQHPVQYGALLFASLGLTGALVAYLHQEIAAAWFAVTLSAGLLFASFIFEIFYPKKTAIINLGLFILGYIYTAIPFVAALHLTMRDGSFDGWVILSVFILIWSFDTFAYLVGKFFGKKKLAPNVSPGKTIAGIFGGLAGAFAGAFVLSYYLPFFSIWAWMIFAVLIGATATLGDLFESRLKREAGMKDSGSFLPGHGGILDRLDSFLFAMPFVYLFFIIYDLIP
jgi:phosphatidate cytidylyltransferase